MTPPKFRSSTGHKSL